jgi:BlaI family transcriptional regulator, penicillinase repressor
MARPKHEHPTPAELEVLKVLWERGASTVRDVLDEFTQMRRRRAYTSVMSLMNVMADKGLLRRRRRGRAFVYEPRIAREATLSDMIGDLCDRAFESSAPLLVSRLLEQANPSREELDEIRRVIDEYRAES